MASSPAPSRQALHEDARLASAYLRHHASAKRWARLDEIADLLDALGDDAVYRTLTRLADGTIGAARARQELRGLDTPKGPATLIKRGRWARDGYYRTGDAGARQAANDALNLMSGRDA